MAYKENASGYFKETMKIYIAGPFFNEKEINNVKYVEKLLSDRGISYFSPMRHKVEDEEPGTIAWAKKIFEIDTTAMEDCDAVLILYYGNYSDTGTAWECGYAYAKGKPVLLVHIDGNDSNLMMHCGCHSNIDLSELAGYDFDSMPVYYYTGKMF